MPTLTTNFGLAKPLVNNVTDQNLWGGELNTDMDDIDGLMLTAINWTTAAETTSFSVTAPTSGSTTTGSAKSFFLCNATSGSITVTLPTASSAGNGFPVAFKKSDSSANVVTLTPNGVETIDGNATFSLNDLNDSVIIVSNGATWDIISVNPPPITGFIKRVKTQTFSTSGTYTPSSGMLECTIEVIGAGGGGGGITSTFAGGAGGGAGGYARLTTTAAVIGASKPVTIGAGGTAGAAANGTGGTGGTTSVGSLITASGGFGGTGGGGSSTAGGAGGVGTLGDINAHGGAGQWAIHFSNGSLAGQGGNSFLGGGGLAPVSNAAGTNGTLGGGASGGLDSTNAGQLGGIGGAGFVIITEYCSA